MLFLAIIVSICGGFLAYEVLRRFLKTSFFFYALLPIVLSYYWHHIHSNLGWFHWVKTASLVLTFILVFYARFYKSKKNTFVFKIIYLIILINIIEPVIRAWLIPNSNSAILNGIAGVFVACTLPLPRFQSIDNCNFHDFLYDIPYVWIFGYTFWNWTFNYIAFPEIAWFPSAPLLVPLIISFINRKQYAQARLYTLSFYMIIYSTFPFLENIPSSFVWYNHRAAWILSCLILVWTGGYFLYVYIAKAKLLLTKN